MIAMTTSNSISVKPRRRTGILRWKTNGRAHVEPDRAGLDRRRGRSRDETSTAAGRVARGTRERSARSPGRGRTGRFRRRRVVPAVRPTGSRAGSRRDPIPANRIGRGKGRDRPRGRPPGRRGRSRGPSARSPAARPRPRTGRSPRRGRRRPRRRPGPAASAGPGPDRRASSSRWPRSPSRTCSGGRRGRPGVAYPPGRRRPSPPPRGPTTARSGPPSPATGGIEGLGDGGTWAARVGYFPGRAGGSPGSGALP